MNENPTRRSSLSIGFLLFGWILTLALAPSQQNPPARVEKDINLLKLLKIIPSEESVDFVFNKTQFQLHNLLTERPHPKTSKLSQRIAEDFLAGLRQLSSVDEDIVIKLAELAQGKKALRSLTLAVENALLTGKKIYIYGCGTSRRVAFQMESTFWRPFWKDLQNQEKIWKKIHPHLKTSVQDQLIGSVAGGDQALIKSEQGWDDLYALGRLQLEEHSIQSEDVVICLSSSGTTQAAIGAIEAALDLCRQSRRFRPEKAREKLFFIYNNPDELLQAYARSRNVIDEPGITKINLTTGPQAVAGATHLQAATMETFVLGHIIQTAVERVLRRHLSKKELSKLGFKQKTLLPTRLAGFERIQERIQAHLLPAIANLASLEAETYTSGRFSTYFAAKGLDTVFNDCAERSTAFHLYPFDTVERKQRECWTQVWTPAANAEEAWFSLFGRAFRGLDFDFYKLPLTDFITDAARKNSVILNLGEAGNEAKDLYDFSFAPDNIKNRGPQVGDLGIAVSLGPEAAQLKNQDSHIRQFMRLCWEKGARLALIIISDESPKSLTGLTQKLTCFDTQRKDALVTLSLDMANDPMGINQQVALKILLNTHTTALMTRLGRISGNTMTHATAYNLRHIGRATHLIQSHVNHTLTQPAWVKQWGMRKPISYGEANAVLYESMTFLKQKRRKAGQTAATALSLIWILESLRLRQGIPLEEAFRIAQSKGLSTFWNDVISKPRSLQ